MNLMNGILKDNEIAAMKRLFLFFVSLEKENKLPISVSLLIPSHIKVQVVDFVEIYAFLQKSGRNLGFSLKSS